MTEGVEGVEGIEGVVGVALRDLDVGNGGKAESCVIEIFEGAMRREENPFQVGNWKGDRRPSLLIEVLVFKSSGSVCGTGELWDPLTTVSMSSETEHPMLHIRAPVVTSTREGPRLVINGIFDELEGNGEKDPFRGRN